MSLRIILFIVILSESFGWWYAAQTFWRAEGADGRRRVLGVLFATVFTALGIVQLISNVAALGYVVELAVCVPKPLAISSLFTSAGRSLCAWGAGVVAGATENPGPLRRWINNCAESFR